MAGGLEGWMVGQLDGWMAGALEGWMVRGLRAHASYRLDRWPTERWGISILWGEIQLVPWSWHTYDHQGMELVMKLEEVNRLPHPSHHWR